MCMLSDLDIRTGRASLRRSMIVYRWYLYKAVEFFLQKNRCLLSDLNLYEYRYILGDMYVCACTYRYVSIYVGTVDKDE